MRFALRVLCVWCSTSVVWAAASTSTELRVAVAANFYAAAVTLAENFEQQNPDISIQLSSGSTGALAAQIIHGAPFDVFLAADKQRPEALEQRGLSLAGSRRAYAAGQLALVTRDAIFNDSNAALSDAHRHISIDALRQHLSTTKRLAIANPATAPYGEAARAMLAALSMWEPLQPTLVKGTSVLQAYQFVQTGNAERGLVAYSLVVNQPEALLIPEQLYPLVEQHMVILKRTHYPEQAHTFTAFLRSGEAQRQIQTLGYLIPRAYD
ncbi:molybdate ABC transporter substrate-binding protein [Alteromonas oceanisediminis]|uniref:molybdate ABC transporter substrate-binding protein n=1 Tax=Alteromonas oceanisediminis TaxID=2836180 RepID=UPI001BD9C662|nr:molybdate ABC transporter substrate-binding protein [Alteromonas oceanisediminis]MBT0587338.1 molybdate ABC transporter substrate-binding protein [Alteromonas oceanisediminis]